jgi:hypothetical protein
MDAACYNFLIRQTDKLGEMALQATRNRVRGTTFPLGSAPLMAENPEETGFSPKNLFPPPPPLG